MHQVNSFFEQTVEHAWSEFDGLSPWTGNWKGSLVRSGQSTTLTLTSPKFFSSPACKAATSRQSLLLSLYTHSHTFSVCHSLSPYHHAAPLSRERAAEPFRFCWYLQWQHWKVNNCCRCRRGQLTKWYRVNTAKTVQIRDSLSLPMQPVLCVYLPDYIQTFCSVCNN